jgi:hypothetical protein
MFNGVKTVRWNNRRARSRPALAAAVSRTLALRGIGAAVFDGCGVAVRSARVHQ